MVMGNLVECWILFLSLFHFAWLSPVLMTENQDCLSGHSSWYIGTTSYTQDGFLCRNWNDHSGNDSSFLPLDGDNHNYCRNPDSDPQGLWCFTVDPDVKWGYCNVPNCNDDSKIIWTDMHNQSASILSIQANPDVIKQKMSYRGQFQVSVLAGSGHVDSEFSDVTGSYHEQTIFVVDSKSNCILMKNLDFDLTSQHLHGLAKEIQSLAYDWLRQNLYWADATMKWIMVADATLTYYAPIFSTNQGTPKALTLHSASQKLFFSINEKKNSKLYTSDLSGENAVVLLNYPHVRHVTSLAVDSTDNRLYIADLRASGSLVLSTDLNGENLRRHYFRRGSKFVGISAYMDYMFMTDATKRHTYRGNIVHSMWLKSKTSWRSFRLNINGEPRGMKILSRKEEEISDEALQWDDCSNINSCEHICLARKQMQRKCLCAIGYTKVGETECRLSQSNDSFLLVLDEYQRKMFKSPLTSSKDLSNITLLPVGSFEKISYFDIDVIENVIFIAGDNNSIAKTTIHGEELSYFTLPTASEVNSIAVDPFTGNLFYSHRSSQAIYVISKNGNFKRNIMMLSSTYASDIQQIKLDLKYKKIYWTNSYSMEGQGTLMRMNMDGSNPETILSGLQWPKSLAIDYERGSIFVSEAHLMVTYEISLTASSNFTSTIHEIIMPNQEIIEINDIHVLNGTIYFLNQHQIMKKDLTTGVVYEHCSKTFYKSTSISAYDRSTQIQQIESFLNPCENRSCPAICLPTSQTNSICI